MGRFVPELLFFSGAVYGLAWIVVRSRLLAPLRGRVPRGTLTGELLACIVCTSAWAAGILMALAPGSSLLREVRVASVGDVFLLLGWSVFTTWLLARWLGDAT